jgi:hypothetical protein
MTESTTTRQLQNVLGSPGMHGHFQVLAADERFTGLRIALVRNDGVELPRYEIYVTVEDQDLDVAAELATFAAERGLASRFDGTGDVALFEIV